MKSTLITVFIVILVKCVTCELPESVQKCSFGDNKCLTTSMTNVIRDLTGASSKIPLPSLDPLDTNTLELEQTTSTLGVKLKCTNTKIHGLSQAKITKVKGFGEDPNGTHEFFLNAQLLQLIGDYVAEGKIFVLPIQGHGRSNFTIIKPSVKVTIKGEAITKNNEQYMDVKSTKLEVRCERIIFDMKNLFNGQKELSDTLLNVINENWQLIFDDLNVPLFAEINKTIYQIIKSAFDATPYKQLFKP